MKDEVATSNLSVASTDRGFTADFRFKSELSVFAGHFPGHPLVPGVYLIEAVRYGAESALSRVLSIRGVTKTKFSRPVGPDERVRLNVELRSEGDEWTARATIARVLNSGEIDEVVARTQISLV